MPNIGPKGILRHIDDPTKSIVSSSEGTTVTWATSGDSSDTTIVRATAAGKGAHYTGALTTTDNNMIEFCSNNLYFAPQEGHCEAEIIVQFDVVAGLSFNFGFNDDVLETNNTLPMEFSAVTTIGPNATDATFVGFLIDTTDATDDCLHCVWADDGTATQTTSTGRVGGELIKMPGMTLTAAKWFYMKVELDDTGSGNSPRATFLAVDHNGHSEERTFETNLDREVPLCFYFAVENRAATAKNVYIRCPNWAQTMPNM